MSLIILTKSPICNIYDLLSQVKLLIKGSFGQKRGPSVVINSLLNGLDELNYKYKLNVKSNEIFTDDVVFVNSSMKALRWAIKAKKERKIRKLIAGPIMSVLPSDHNGIMLSKEIDAILFPSQWTKDHWLSFEKSLENKIKIWPAGVGLPDLPLLPRGVVLIYFKNAPLDLLNYIQDFFKSKNIVFKTIRYGFYKQDDYFQILNKTKLLIFLSESESQGLAMFESWAHNVPTLVWNRGYWRSGECEWKDEKISSPYLTIACGKFFKNKEEFINNFNYCIQNISSFRPREFVENNFTNKKIAKLFLKFIED